VDGTVCDDCQKRRENVFSLLAKKSFGKHLYGLLVTAHRVSGKTSRLGEASARAGTIDRQQGSDRHRSSDGCASKPRLGNAQPGASRHITTTRTRCPSRGLGRHVSARDVSNDGMRRAARHDFGRRVDRVSRACVTNGVHTRVVHGHHEPCTPSCAHVAVSQKQRRGYLVRGKRALTLGGLMPPKCMAAAADRRSFGCFWRDTRSV
jgi:hypothetical protein